jgi:uncharacterized caspase-like protein
MKSFRAALIFGVATLLVCTSSYAAEPRTRGVQITPKSELTLDKLYSQSHAIVIGISTYTGFPPVEYAAKDARAMEQKLLSMGFRTKVLLDGEATKDGILKALGEELPQKAEQKDRVVIFFAGHTKMEEKTDRTSMGYLVPADADAKNLSSTSISIDQIREISGRIKAGHLLFLVDAPVSGLGLTASETIPLGARNYFQKVASQKSHQLFTAGGKGGAPQTTTSGLSIFTSSVLEGLNGSADREKKGFITSQELASYVKLQVSRSTGAKQTIQFGNLSGKGEILFSSKAPATIEPKATAVGSEQETKTVEAASKSGGSSVGKSDALDAVEIDSPRAVQGGKSPETGESSLAAKQAQMEELKRLDADRTKTQVALKQQVAPAVKTLETGRFIARSDGTVLDTRTSLMWAAKDNGSNINWPDARRYCESYRAGGYTDWRLPTQEELAGLYDESITNTNPPTAGCNGSYHLTDLIHLTCCCPWTSETRGSTAAYYGFSNGPRNWVDQSYTGGIRVLPVRSAK